MDSTKYWENGEPLTTLDNPTTPTGGDKYWINGEVVPGLFIPAATTDTTKFFLLF